MPASLRITYLKPINQRSHYILFSLYSHRIRCIRIRFALANSTLLEVSLFKISMRRGQDSKSCPKAFPRSLFARSDFRRSDSRHIPLLKATSNPMKGFDCLRNVFENIRTDFINGLGGRNSPRTLFPPASPKSGSEKDNFKFLEGETRKENHK